MASVTKTLKALPQCNSVTDLYAALDALPDEPGPWTKEQDAILIKYWGKKGKDSLLPQLMRLLDRSAHAIECRTVTLRANGAAIGRYISKPRR